MELDPPFDRGNGFSIKSDIILLRKARIHCYYHQPYPRGTVSLCPDNAKGWNQYKQ